MVIEIVECKICGSSRQLPFEVGKRHLNLNGELNVSRCKDCGQLFLNPRPDEQTRQKLFEGKKVEELLEYTNRKASYCNVTPSRADIFSKRIKNFTKTYFSGGPGKVLDVGASSGEFLEKANDQGWTSFGIEPSSEGIKILEEKGIDAKQSQAEEIPYADSSFDWVHSNHVFEHLGNPLAAARESYRVLKPGGWIFIEVPNQFDNIQFFRYRMIRKIPVRERNIRSIHHLFFFSKKTLRLLLKRAGFKEIEILDYYGSKRKGIQSFGSDIVRLIGRIYLGGPFIQAIAKK